MQDGGSGLDACEACEGMGHDVRNGWRHGLHMRMAECWDMMCGTGQTVWMHVRHIEGVPLGGGQLPEYVGCIATSASHARLSQNACAVVALEGKKVNHVA